MVSVLPGRYDDAFSLPLSRLLLTGLDQSVSPLPGVFEPCPNTGTVSFSEFRVRIIGKVRRFLRA